MSEINDKHLEFIQGVINRHNSNSFRIKGWAITITAAIFALTGTIKEPFLCFIALGPTIMFWVLDSMFLANERSFVSLYSCVANGNKLKVKKDDLKKDIQKAIEGDFKEYTVKPYSMNFVQFKELKRNNWTNVFLSYTIRWFYIALTVLTIVTFLGLRALSQPTENNPIKIDATIKNAETLRIEPIEINTNTLSVDTIKIKDISQPKKTSKPAK
jgi:ribosomal protein L23